MLKNLCQVLVLACSIRAGACANTSAIFDSFEDTSCNDDCAIQRMLKGRPASELPELKSSFIEDDAALLKASELMLDQPDSLHRTYTMSDMGVMGFATIAQSVSYSWIFSHLYDNYNDMRLAAGPSVDNEQCIGQLENLVARAELLARERYNSTDVNFYQLMDTWGRTSSGMLLGNLYMEGMYNECGRLKIELPGGRQAPTRYCTLSIRHKSWPSIDKKNVLGIQVGICIPKACDSSVYKNKLDLLIRLLEHQMRKLDEGQIVPSNLYCLPDEDSPLRSILASPKATATVALLASWLALLVYCTYMDRKLSAPAAAIEELKDTTEDNPAGDGRQRSARRKMCDMLSISKNLTRLFSIDKTSSLMESSKKQFVEQETGEKQEIEDKVVDLGCIEGIKVIAMQYIIMGHVLMCLPTIMLNGREISGKNSLAFFMANLPPAFAVNAFFSITGTLTCYMMLKQNQSHKFITSPAKWIALFVYRYLRIMPVYALVVLYCKTLAKYTGSGPLWDYATSSLSQRRTCEQEPWTDTLLFKSNYAQPLTSCIPGGWYLANDFQFFLVTPFFLALLHKRPIIGQTLVLLSIVASFVAGFWNIFSTNVSDTRPIATFAPHGFKTYVSHFSSNYTRPQYRISAYLVGLLVGYRLYRFERARVEFRAFIKEWQRRQHEPEARPSEMAHQTLPQLPEPDWSWYFKKIAIPLSLFIVIICSVTPLISYMLPFNKLTAHFAVAAIMPLYHVVFALAVGFYLLIASTTSGTILANFLAANCWKVLARLSLCALLVNVEVINYIIQGSTSMYYVSNQFHVALNCVCIMATYLVSIVVCVLFEAPMRAALNALLTNAIKQFSTQTKRQKSVETC